tara:strand:- start:3103 stop:3435 length:333 start_codon:yes stop_codon:yes gene_type:complete
MDNKHKISDKVVALNSTPPEFAERCQPRVKGNVYTVIDVMFCNTCGEQVVNVSNTATEREYLLCSCRRDKMPTKGVHWTVSGNFAPIDEMLNHAVEVEDYEYACILRDAI